MPPDAALAEIAWDASAAAAHKERRKAETARAARKRRVNAARPRPHPGPAAAALLDAGKAGRVSPRVFAGLVRLVATGDVVPAEIHGVSRSLMCDRGSR